MTDYRAELQRLVKAYDEHHGIGRHHDRALFRAVKAARATLAQPEPEGVELAQAGTVESADAMELIATETGLEWNCDVGMYLCSVHDLEAIARAVLTRYARPTIESVPVAERPWERDGWCNSDNEAFFFDSDTKKWSLCKCDKYSPVMTNASDRYAHSLPHHALPVPGAEVG